MTPEETCALETLERAETEFLNAQDQLLAAEKRFKAAERARDEAMLSADTVRYTERVVAYLIANRDFTRTLVVVQRDENTISARPHGHYMPLWEFRRKGKRWVSSVPWRLTPESVAALPPITGDNA